MPTDQARTELAECAKVVARLHKMCCDPERSPRLTAIEESLSAIGLDIDDARPAALQRAINGLEDVGSRVGSLQVACCAPPRMPLYAAALRHLNVARNEIAAELGVGH